MRPARGFHTAGPPPTSTPSAPRQCLNHGQAPSHSFSAPTTGRLRPIYFRLQHGQAPSHLLSAPTTGRRRPSYLRTTPSTCSATPSPSSSQPACTPTAKVTQRGFILRDRCRFLVRAKAMQLSSARSALACASPSSSARSALACASPSSTARHLRVSPSTSAPLRREAFGRCNRGINSIDKELSVGAIEL